MITVSESRFDDISIFETDTRIKLQWYLNGSPSKAMEPCLQILSQWPSMLSEMMTRGQCLRIRVVAIHNAAATPEAK